MPPEAGPLSEEEKELARKNHIAFITKIYIFNITFLGISNVQWYILTENKTIQSMINKNSQLGMFVGFFTYLGMLCQIHFGDAILNSTCMTWIYTITMAELGSVSIAMACSDANLANLLCALACSIILLTICILLSKSLTTQPFRDMDYLTLWTVRFFIVALMGIIVSKSCGDEYVEAFLMMFTASFMTMVLAKELAPKNSSECNTCDRRVHLKCDNMGTRSYFTCKHCDTVLNEDEENDD